MIHGKKIQRNDEQSILDCELQFPPCAPAYMGRGVFVVWEKRLFLIEKRIKLFVQGGKHVDRTIKQGYDLSTPETTKAGENPGNQVNKANGAIFPSRMA